MKFKHIVMLLMMVMQLSINAQSTLTINVYGNCGMCQDRIENAAKGVIGVTSASWDMTENTLTVTYQNGLFSEPELHKQVAAVGHDTDKVKATDEVYANMHGCCKYRPEDNGSTKGGQHDESNKVSGMVYELGATGESQPLIGANVYFVGAEGGEATDLDGYFSLHIPHDLEDDLLVISYLGFENDTIDLQGNKTVAVTMKTSLIMEEVEIVHKKKSTQVSFIDPIKVQRIGEKELFKAACCNLSESFETNPSVDAGATDAVTGTRKIEMLGLAGPYVQVNRENMPYIRGLAALYGFSYTPGTWVESIQLNMGAGSVVNGPESMTGQINVEIRKPELSEKLFLNLYANAAGRLEANLNTAAKINDKWSTGLLLHGNYQDRVQDRNDDGFQDMPNNTQFIAMNRWKYNSGKGRFAQFGIKGTYIDKSSGQYDTSDGTSSPRWRADVLTERLEGWAKIGRVFEGRPYASVGLQLGASHHNQESLFGLRRYDGQQSSLYANLIYQTIISDTRHQIKFGTSYQYDDFDEVVESYSFVRNEHLAGVFTEYQYVPNDQWTAVLGLRADYHNNFGLFATPRLHLKYNPSETTSWRFAAGRGQRTATIFAENVGLFASNRAIIVDSDPASDNPYGLTQEVSYNIGANFTKEFIINQRSAIFGVDYYYTTFQNQVVVDYDINPQEVHFYNLDGNSSSHSIQSQLDVELLDGFDMRVAYRFNNPTTDFQDEERVRPLIAKHRAFANLAYETESKWSFDLTANWQSSKRIPSTMTNPEGLRFDTESPSFVTFNGQVTKTVAENFDVYIGGENLLDFRQQNAILDVENPFGGFFDSSLVWGPIQGRVIYAGLRYKIP